MDRHKCLYKENSSMLSPRQHNKINRQIQKDNRAQKRKDIFLNSRRISVSPCSDRNKPVLMCVTSTPAPSTAKKQKVLLSFDKQKSQEDNKENAVAVEQLPNKDEQKTSRIAKVACTAVAEVHKLNRQETFLMRFIEWKENKKEQEVLRKQQQQAKRRPFVPSGSSYKIPAAVVAAAPSTSSFVPKNHQFKAPDGLKNPLKDKPSSSVPNGLLRKSFYTVVPTPPRKKAAEADLKKFPTARKVPHSLKSHAFGSTPSRTPTTTTIVAAKKTVAQPVKINAHTPAASAGRNQVINRKTPGAVVGNIKKPTSTVALNNKNTPRGNLKSAAPITTKTTAAGKSVGKAAPVAAKAAAPKPFVKPRPLILPPPPPPPAATKKPSARIVKPIRGGVGGVSSSTASTSGAIGKAKQLANKRTAAADPHSLHNNKAKLATSMKAKKTTAPSASNAIKRAQNVNLKFIGKTLLGVPEAPIVAETPTDLANLNPFEAFVTSTKLKSSSLTHQSSEEFPDEGDTISPVEPLDVKAMATPSLGGRSSSTSAKRVLMKEKDDAKKRKSKFNFVRYSELEATMVAAHEEVGKQPEESKGKRKVEEKKQMVQTEATVSELKTPEEETDDTDKTLQKTPTKEESGDRPANYLSPFVSVSRGKVNARKEQEKRNSIYLQRAPELTPENKKEEAVLPDNVQNHTPVEVRRALETARYFRKQVSDEIVRLHAICDQWDAYKDEHLPRLQETGGEDMINVTVGQTKLLTSKKFKQFSGLIDRCEAGATGTGVECDGSEKTKPITVVDLEGFWSMVGLQVDNVDKRFENLQRWRDNNWIDPEEVVKVKTKKNLSKVKKTKAAAATTVAAKAKPSSALQQMLRKMHAEMRKINATEAAAAGDDVVILTPNRKKRRSHSSTPTSSSASKRLSSGTPRRISIIVKDRKSRSAAATVVSIPAASRPNRASLARKSSQDSPKLLPHVEQLRRSLTNLQKATDRTDLLKTALIGATADLQQQQQQHHRRKSVVRSDSSTTPPTSPLRTMNGRKSILKTPGTAKGKPKSVIFNEQLRIKKFKFTVDEDNRSDDDDKEELAKAKTEDGPDERQYTLRTRKVRLRPSSEFEIPK